MQRLIARELMDDETCGASPAEWRQTFDDLTKVNAFLGGSAAVISEVQRLKLQPNTILDVASGAGDVAVALLDFLRAQGIDARGVALDRSEPALTACAERIAGRSDITVTHGDATELPFADQSFDLAMINLALHHFDPAQATAVLRELARVGRTALVNDLRRSLLAWAFAALVLPLFTRNRLTLHDGPISVRRAYTPDELRGLAQEAGWRRISIRKHFGYRMTLTGGFA